MKREEKADKLEKEFLKEEKKEKLFLDITQGIPGVGLYRDYHFCLFGIYQP